MVLDLRCIRARRFARRARPRAGPRGASNLGISSLVPGIGSYWYVSTEIATGAAPTENSVETFPKWCAARESGPLLYDNSVPCISEIHSEFSDSIHFMQFHTEFQYDPAQDRRAEH
eukprot:COSAG02_NODE_202_length_29305_cov_20.432377_11_plen_116_part_00